MQSNFRNIKILITGCAGFISSFITQSFLEKGAYVYGIDDLSTGSKDNMEEFSGNRNFNFLQEDVCNGSLIKSLVPKVDYVYHGAVRGLGVSTKNPLEELRVNTQSTLILLEAIRQFGIKRFVFPSSASVYGNPKTFPEKESDPTIPLSPYGVSKLAAERYCLAYHHLYKIPVVCLRYFNTYGPRQRADSIYGGVVSIFIRSAIKGKPLEIYGDGNQTRDFTYIDDTVKATMRVFTARNLEGKVINIAGGKEYSVNELAMMIREIAGVKKKFIKHIQRRLVDNIDRRVGEISFAKELLRYKPATALKTGLQITHKWNKQKYAEKN